MISFRFLAVAALAVLAPTCALADYSAADSAVARSARYVFGPAQFALNREVTVAVPDSIELVLDTDKMVQVTHVFLTYGDIIATAVPMGEGERWLAYFRYIGGGHVPESSRLNAPPILTDIQMRDRRFNEERARRGASASVIDGWMDPPSYDLARHSLEWTAHATRQEGGIAIHSVRLLGRSGHVHVEMHCMDHDLQASLPRFRELMRGVVFTKNHRYEDYRHGDRLASYHLNSIVAGEDYGKH